MADSPKTGGMSSRDKIVIGLLIAILVPVNLVGAVLWFYRPRMPWGSEFVVVIDRRTASESDQLALAAAETVNYSLVLQRPPFWNYHDAWVPNLDGDTWINYISNQTVTHLLDRVDYHRQKGSQVRIHFNCTAICFWVPNASLEAKTDGLRVSNGTDDWVVRGSSHSYLHESLCALRVNDTYQVKGGIGYLHEVVGTYGDAFFVYMYVYYDEIWGQVAGYTIRFDQFVILNAAYEVLVVLAIDGGHLVY